MNSIVKRIVYSIACLLIFYVAIYFFENTIGARLDYQLDPAIDAMREDGKFIAYVGLVIFISISQLFFQKIIDTQLWKIIISVFFLITLEESFFNIAHGYRAEFGATWTSMEVRIGLVLYFWQTWVALVLSTTCFICLLWGLVFKRPIS